MGFVPPKKIFLGGPDVSCCYTNSLWCCSEV